MLLDLKGLLDDSQSLLLLAQGNLSLDLFDLPLELLLLFKEQVLVILDYVGLSRTVLEDVV